MRTPHGSRDARTGRVTGFQSEAQRENFLAARARFSDGPNRLMPRCSATTRLGQPCKAARMRGQSTCYRHGAGKRARLAAAHLSGDLDRIQRAEMRTQRNRLRVIWRHDPRAPRTIMLLPDDEASCRSWAARQGFLLEVLDRDLPALSDACRWIWARMSRGLISDDEMVAKLARLRSRIVETNRVLGHSG
jgi:hypothetical protein